MGVIRHDNPGAQLIALALKEAKCAGHKTGKFRTTHMTTPVAGVEIFVHAIRIPAEKFFLLTPCERSFRGEGLLLDCFAFLFEPQQDFLRKGARFTKGDEICAAFLFEMRQHPAKMKPTGQRIGRAMWRGRPGCEFGRRLAASI
ncbi:MAG: hypothetical protein QOF48_2933 [Verrucomicrobiota bacterium]|jgi:hypothetical protein